MAWRDGLGDGVERAASRARRLAAPPVANHQIDTTLPSFPESARSPARVLLPEARCLEAEDGLE